MTRASMQVIETSNPIPPRPRSRRRFGCLGCVGQVIVTLFLGALLYLAMIGALMPWGYYLGGRFHLIPCWQGWGRLHSNASGDYLVFVRFEPSFRGGDKIHPSSHLKGIGYLCTPRGERFRLNLNGSMRLHLNANTNGEKVSLYMDNWPLLTGPFISDHRPGLTLTGQWQNPDLVMNDAGSIWNSFEPDGTVYRGNDRNRPYAKEIIPVTLKEGSYSEFEAACPAGHH